MTTADLDTAPVALPTDPLAAVRAALLAAATADAQRVLAGVDAEVAEARAAAEERAAALRDAAAAQAAADAATIAAEARARARRQERAILLAAQRSAYEQLRAQARAAVRDLRRDPGYPALLTRLTAAARQRLGPTALVREHPDGGVLAEDGGRRLSLTLDAATDRAVDALGAEVEQLWQR
ncbi:MAG: hypothetical protein ACXV2H_07855 [Actinomycetes bacterium]